MSFIQTSWWLAADHASSPLSTSFGMASYSEHPAIWLGTLVWPLVQEIVTAGYPLLKFNEYYLWNTRFNRKTGKLVDKRPAFVLEWDGRPWYWIIFEGCEYDDLPNYAEHVLHIRKKNLGNYGAVTDGREWFLCELPNEPDVDEGELKTEPVEFLSLGDMKSCEKFDTYDQAQEIVDWILRELREQALENPVEWTGTPEWQQERERREAERKAGLEQGMAN